MKKLVISIAVLAVVAAALATAGFVYAQSTNPQGPTPGTGYGMMGGRGMRGGMMGGYGSTNVDQAGPMHDDMVAAFAAKLGLTVDEINTRLAKGETMYQIAASKGLSSDEIRSLMLDARNQALDQAVKDSTLTQAQADWMKQHSAGMMSGGYGRGMMQGQTNGMPCLDQDDN
jgi:hypothetical protein